MSTCEEKSCPCMEPCPMLYAMKILGGKWKISILCALKLGGPTRYNSLMRKIMDRRAIGMFGETPLGRFKERWSVEQLDRRFAAEELQSTMLNSGEPLR